MACVGAGLLARSVVAALPWGLHGLPRSERPLPDSSAKRGTGCARAFVALTSGFVVGFKRLRRTPQVGGTNSAVDSSTVVATKALPEVLAPPRNKSMDSGDRHWESAVSRIGPPLQAGGSSAAVTPDACWASGQGQLRVACYEAGHVTRMSLSEETLCLGTRSGLVRTVDVDSGSVVGEYHVKSHIPGSPITALHFDGSAVLAGTALGAVYIWRAQLPGSWGFAASPEVVCMQSLEGEASYAHRGEITGLLTVSDNLLASSSRDGTVVFWDTRGAKEHCLLPERIVELASVEVLVTKRLEGRDEQKPVISKVPVLCLCVSGSGTDVYAGLQDGSLFRVSTSGESKCLLEPSNNAVTSLAFDADTEALLIGRASGSVAIWKQGADQPSLAAPFHKGMVYSLAVRPSVAGGPRLCISTGEDGRVGVWDISNGKPLWGLRGLCAEDLCAVADGRRLFANGLVVNPELPSNIVLKNSWKKAKADQQEVAPACEGVLCMELPPKRRS